MTTESKTEQNRITGEPLTPEQKMMIYEYFMRTGATTNEIVKHFPEMNLSYKDLIRKAIHYGRFQTQLMIAHLSEFKYFKPEILIVAE